MHVSTHTCTHTHTLSRTHTHRRNRLSQRTSRAHSGLSGFYSVRQGNKCIQSTRIEVMGDEGNQRGWTSMLVNLNACQRRGQKGFEGKSPIGMLIVSILLWLFWVLFLSLGMHTKLWRGVGSSRRLAYCLWKRGQSVVEKSFLPKAFGEIIPCTGLRFKRKI